MARRNRGGMRYIESEPKATTSGIGKDYRNFRIFHSVRSGMIERIENDGAAGPASAAEIEQFRRDLGVAAARDKEIRGYLARFPALRDRMADETGGMKPEPEGIAAAPEGARPVSPSAGGTGEKLPEAAQGERPQTAR